MDARTALVSALGTCFCVVSFAQQPLPASTAAQFIISGTSTVRSWSCPATGTIKVTPGSSAAPLPGYPHGVQTLVIAVPLANIACEEAEMGTHLRDAMRAATYPAIEYQLHEYTLDGANTAKLDGRLTITDVTKPLALDVKLAETPLGLRVTGETTIDMTQFNVTPPDLWGGLLRVGNNVRIRFDAVLSTSGGTSRRRSEATGSLAQRVPEFHTSIAPRSVFSASR